MPCGVFIQDSSAATVAAKAEVGREACAASPPAAKAPTAPRREIEN
jgi:hypothetical protein